MPWNEWRTFFESRASRPLPASIAAAALPDEQRLPLLRSIRTFQAGETGEGRIVHEIERLQCLDVNDDYRAALRLIIAEEGRHARVLGLCVRALGGVPTPRTAASRAFTWARRAAGLRMKLLVLFAAEVIGIVFYGAISAALPPCPLAAQIAEIGRDEVAHYEFHTLFFRQYGAHPLKRLVFKASWAFVMLMCTSIVLIDHWKTLRALGISPLDLGRRCTRLYFEMNQALLRGPCAPPTRYETPEPCGHSSSRRSGSSLAASRRSTFA